MNKKIDEYSTIILLRGVWSHLSRLRKIQFCTLFIVMLLSGTAELASLGAVLPFLAVLSNPEQFWGKPGVQSLANRLGYAEADQLIIPVTAVFAATSVLAALIRLSNLWINGRLAAAIGSDLSCEAYRRTLFQPYEVHLKRNSATVITSVTTQTSRTISALNSLLQLLTSVVVACGLLIGLLFIDPLIALATLAFFGAFYLTMALASQRELQSNSRKVAVSSAQQLQVLQEGLGAIRDILLGATHDQYLQSYQKADRTLRVLQAKNNFLGAYPRYALEALGMVAIAILGGLLVLQRSSGSAVIPLLGALALGAQRLLPALQHAYSGWAVLKGHHSAMQDVLTMLNQPLPAPIPVKPQSFSLKNKIQFENVMFRYSHDAPEVLKMIELEINRGDRIGFIGTTGSGKSTLIDLLMGLMPPSSGKIFVDGKNLHDRLKPELLMAWRSSISHVPQSIYLVDGSISENIAFGIPKSEVNMSRVYQAASQAQMTSFIDSLPYGFDTYVGERGIRLSGGQRQRIGIARALYKKAEVLIFDEATSALDNNTEKALMAAIESLGKELTIVMIAHRLSTIENCDRVIKLENGMVVYDGNPKTILDSN